MVGYDDAQAREELAARGLAIVYENGTIDLTRDGRDFLLLAIWQHLGCPGFEPEWYHTHERRVSE